MFFGATAQAMTFTEIGDAGQSLGTAQGGGNITEIFGNISDVSDADLFSFAWSGGVFSATTDLPETVADTQLFLFNAAGLGIVGNDDNASNGGLAVTPFPSTITSIDLDAGNYFLGVSASNNDPVSANGTIFEPIGSPFGVQATPTGPGALASLADWQVFNTFGTGNYRILITDSTAVPTPAILPGLIGMGVAAIRRRKQETEKSA